MMSQEYRTLSDFDIRMIVYSAAAIGRLWEDSKLRHDSLDEYIQEILQTHSPVTDVPESATKRQIVEALNKVIKEIMGLP